MSATLSLPQVLLVLDVSAILASDPRGWQEYERVAQCWIPQVVYDEIHTLSQTAPDRQNEQTARMFLKFLEQSNWQLTADESDHPALQPAPGHALSQRARANLAVLRCAYGVARHNPNRLVVLVSDDSSMAQRLAATKQANLCGIPVSALRLWSRSARRPAPVSHQMHVMRTVPMPREVGAVRTQTLPSISPQPPQTSTLAPTPRLRPVRSSHAYPAAWYQVLSTLLSLAAVLAVIGVGWYVLSPNSLNRFLQRWNLPTLPRSLS